MKVKEELKKLGIKLAVVELGVIKLVEPLTNEQLAKLNLNLKKSGLELLDNKRSILVESIKNIVTEMIHQSEEVPKVNFSDFISEKLGFHYTYLSNVFTEVKGITIQHYIIINKIERVKELLLYQELSLSEIAYRMHYSSTAHLSNQFKKITGLTPSFYRSITTIRRQNLDEL
jgi:AraC-like DNA-binding protein